ncbi:hypothetical protein EW146_g10142 [Bondarzewia mesenterica]|uniref:Integrase catalytic domain-containing protein n=1 Tax=Bondarzewia mesenterica TaxID=1095465 RepID=A0A4S4L025_9AGAM|nr:hypothetical protein EW146_g10142 [Bondarzewia mesenterica]
MMLNQSSTASVAMPYNAIRLPHLLILLQLPSRLPNPNHNIDPKAAQAAPLIPRHPLLFGIPPDELACRKACAFTPRSSTPYDTANAATTTSTIKEIAVDQVNLTTLASLDSEFALAYGANVSFCAASVPSSPSCTVDWHEHTAAMSSLAPSPTGLVTFHLDSASTCHIFPAKSGFSDFSDISPRAIKGINSSFIFATSIRTVHLCLTPASPPITLSNVLFVPLAALHLISIGALCDSDLVVSFGPDSCSISHKDKPLVPLARGSRRSSRLYAIDGISSVGPHDMALLTHTRPTIDTWHRCLGHPHFSATVSLLCDQLASGIITDLSTSPSPCTHCILGKQTKLPVPQSHMGTWSTHPLEIIYADIMGPISPLTLSGWGYTLDIRDDFSSSSFAYTLHTKSNSLLIFHQWRASAEHRTGHTISLICTDNGTEFTSATFESYLAEHSISHQTSAPYTSAHIGSVERFHHTLFDRAHAMHSATNLPAPLWGECYQMAAYLHSFIPSRFLNGKTPFELLYSTKPNLSHLCEFGCHAFVLIQNHYNPKINNRSIECILVGYSFNFKSYHLFHHPTNNILISRNVHFLESHDFIPRSLNPGVVITSPPSNPISSISLSPPFPRSRITKPLLRSPNKSTHKKSDTTRARSAQAPRLEKRSRHPHLPPIFFFENSALEAGRFCPTTRSNQRALDAQTHFRPLPSQRSVHLQLWIPVSFHHLSMNVPARSMYVTGRLLVNESQSRSRQFIIGSGVCSVFLNRFSLPIGPSPNIQSELPGKTFQSTARTRYYGGKKKGTDSYPKSFSQRTPNLNPRPDPRPRTRITVLDSTGERGGTGCQRVTAAPTRPHALSSDWQCESLVTHARALARRDANTRSHLLLGIKMSRTLTH